MNTLHNRSRADANRVTGPRHGLLLSLVGLGSLLTAPDAPALGVRVPNQDATAIGRGNAFVATADNPAAIYYNPAGISQLEGHNIQVGSLFYMGIYGDHDSPAGVRTENDPEVIPVPAVHYVFTPAESSVSFGLGVYEPFGFSVKWPNDAPFRQEGLEGRLTYITINPVVAWKIHPRFSVAAGPTFNYSEIELEQALLPLPNLVPGDRFRFKGDNWGYGYNVGLLWQPHPQWSFGASYRAASRLNYRGDASIWPVVPPLPASASTSSKLEYPQIVIAGISYRPTPRWNLEINVDWADWQTFDELEIPPYAKRKLDWKSSFMYEAGVTHYWSTGYFFSAGYFFSEASTTKRYFTPLVPDTDLHIGSLGGGYRGRCWSWALAAQIIAGDWRKVTVDANSVNPGVNGQYRLFTPTVSFSVGYHF